MSTNQVNDLIQWGLKNGAQIPDGIEFIEVGNKGVCCMTTEELDNVSIKIPSTIIISHSLLFEVFDEQFISSQNKNTLLKFLVGRLMFDRNSTNDNVRKLSMKFRPYLDLLPKEMHSPLIWNPSELQFLVNTNLGNSIKNKLQSIYKEWYQITKFNESLFNHNEIKEEFIIYESFDELSELELYERLLHKANELESPVWYSFIAFLWSHLIFISRAFPEYVVNKQAPTDGVVLLPIIDLLNHNYSTKVEWLSDNDGSFCYRNLSVTPANTELNNNYGGKGNEELLSGYGFVMKDNLFDSVALKINLPETMILQILQDAPEISLPTIDDYTWFAFDENAKADETDAEKPQYKDGLLYFINCNNDKCLNDVLDLFSHMGKDTSETWKSPRARFHGLQLLRNALEHKLSQINLTVQAQDSADFPINPYRLEVSQIYRDGQIKIFKHCLSLLKKIEREQIKKYKNILVTVNKVFKNDDKFTDELTDFYDKKDPEDIKFGSSMDILTLWILIKVLNNSFPSKYEKVQDQYTQYIKRHATDEYKLSNTANDFEDLVLLGSNKVTPRATFLAVEFVNDNSFTRVSSQETILVLTN
ncbi:hypothetical protein TPHA_0J02430 [Tetrapisispora phaffii CBS 4417]|uniref:SET domain-containing protein n=1 Tax=Tetrapisispora phaffii (strain ATCC 24235 / CBS 4417 / NBRC 1672 / NRRL Y-8282 / UCD 70-5) TaxID=1071381 RepID=G8BYX1_TETPH|nr:hypothetical protein TPHA_0J02430 [Tetrapisispora phaffii CBS 4417]CCE65063.1 hypothetical protein TPHA_0J02430 [Tetrapisispora phaffii CBS 4417]